MIDLVSLIIIFTANYSLLMINVRTLIFPFIRSFNKKYLIKQNNLYKKSLPIFLRRILYILISFLLYPTIFLVLHFCKKKTPKSYTILLVQKKNQIYNFWKSIIFYLLSYQTKFCFIVYNKRKCFIC
jgi:hypothetical protein